MPSPQVNYEQDEITERDVVAALPDVDCILTRFLLWAKKRTASHLGNQIGPAMSLLGSTVPQDLTFPYAQDIAPNLFCLTVGPSGEGMKTTPLNYARSIMLQAAPNQVLDHPTSGPALMDQLMKWPVGTLYYDEFEDFLAKAKNDRSHMHSVKTEMNKLFNTDRIARQRVRNEDKADTGSRVVVDPRLFVVGAVAEGYLARFTTIEDWREGFMGRWFVMYCGLSGRVMPWGGQGDPDLEAWLVQEVAKRSMVPTCFPCGGPDDAADKLWRAWYPDVTNREIPEMIRGVRSRVPTIALKIAMLLCWDQQMERVVGEKGWRLDAAILQNAIDLAELHLRSIVRAGLRVTENPDLVLRRKVIDAFHRHGALTLGEVITAARIGSRRKAMDVVETLREEALIGEVSSSVQGKTVYALVEGLPKL